MSKLIVTDLGIVNEDNGELVISREIFIEAFGKYIKDSFVREIEENAQNMINRNDGYYGHEE